ncbi:energy-coupling factor transport system permease protein [Kaistia soli DSM 19436]|uniref:Energy-coupling factor transport system permease protein n=1 Tax=Kaistia soli DSM 19436 TaxID=1122133 RepID=A0A1M5FYW9_9HYPH|nr:energy-coupling factor transporter transmembrane component T [Kaistia soli]SHF96725.1 energy-coupling factor transport system permease protein [Kaistia soli DSM 19436]
MASGSKQEAGKQSLLFTPGESLLHKANPLTSLVIMLWMISAAAVLPTAGTAILVLAAITVSMATGVGKRSVKRLLITMTPIGVALIVVHGLLIERPDQTDLGLVAISPDGLDYALKVFMRVAAMLMATLLFVTTTHPSEMLKALDQRGVPPGVGYLVASPLLLIEPFSDRAKAIRDAQRVRGLDLTGSWKARIIALPILLMPLITLALSDLDQRASILSGRAFRAFPRRTVINAPHDSTFQVWFRRILVAVAVLQLGIPLLWHF